MRDPNRIDEFCKALAEAWHTVPDWRFGQLFMNLPFPYDPFFMEDDEMLRLIQEMFGTATPAEGTGKEPIAPDEVANGLDNGTVRLIEDPNGDTGTVCQIGDGWFRFGNTEDEELAPDEYARAVSRDEIARRICEALMEIQDNPDATEEWEGYRRAVIPS